MLRKVSSPGAVGGAHAVSLPRGTLVIEKAGVKLLDVEQLRRVALSDIESVLNDALQDAVDDPNWSDHLLHYAGLFDQLQSDSQWPDGLIVARALRDGLLQALDQRGASALGLDELSRRALIEQRLDDGPIGRFGWALRTGDLHAAAACVQEVQALNEVLALEMASDVVEVLTTELAHADLRVGWATIETRPVFEDQIGYRMADLRRQFVVVLRAWSVLQCLNMAPSLPLASSCQRWLLERLPTDEVQPAVLDLLKESRNDRALRSVLMDLFEQALCSSSAKPEELEWLILQYAEHIDLADVLAPIRPPADPKALPVSGFDRLIELAQKLADPSHRERVGQAHQDAWRTGWAVLLDLSQYLFEHKGETSCLDVGEEEIPLAAWQQLPHYLRRRDREPKVSGADTLFFGIWLCSASNGLRSVTTDGYMLSRLGLKWSQMKGYDLLPFWEPPVRERLFASLASHALKGLSQPQQQALLRRNLMGILLRSTVAVLTIAVKLAAQMRFAPGPDWATASVEACLQWADEVCGDTTIQGTKGEALAQLWRYYADRHPEWLDAMKTRYPWVSEAIDELEQGEKQGYRTEAIISRRLKEQLIKQ
ncbi:MAG: hypothetical protein GTN84_17865 [Hydrogenophaga sp.]|uniref:hypothetical protein n=1 Tax=Hydrogenophaga sp. TaxID=1904254 RepID=UPI0016B929F7|nr:hypothetical protein [Hydrogenophaga sp.]NIM43111.1 hypothetical protein [Hydrogenophaga sp.]NIN28179.1 hypothetical protein [Hydrogenophaga sp.]NIN30617.1 hypothetical protein [Hydrogenophaga sp.]NIN57314.1 hypothetical protein [Hydrogenophaga sp.]NIO51533.1 hypothetical protein [Hydrogenophaga sp.]